METISAEIGGWQLVDINVFISDTVLAIVCLVCYFKLQNWLEERLDRRYWRLFFLVLGISAFLGGVGHLFYAYDWHIYIMLVSWSLNAVAVFFLERAIIEQIRQERWRKWLILLIYVKLVVAIILLFIKQSYNIAAIMSAAGMIGILLPIVLTLVRERTGTAVYYFVGGFLISAVAGLAFMLKWDISRWINHADVGHYLIGVSMVLFYFAVRWLKREAKLYPAREVWY